MNTMEPSKVCQLEAELKMKESSVAQLEAELRIMQRKIANRDAEISRQERELHKLKSVLQQASSLFSSNPTCSNGHHLLQSAVNSMNAENKATFQKKQAVSGPSPDPANNSPPPLPRVKKDFTSQQQIRSAIRENDFLASLGSQQIREIIDYMDLKEIPAGQYVVKEGDIGSDFFVSAEGEYEVMVGGRVLSKLSSGKVFGELAILYNCKRTASIKALKNGKVWFLDRDVFQKIMVRTGVQRMQDQLKFLKSVPLLDKLPDDALCKLSDAFETVKFNRGDYIVREGTTGNTFFIIIEGQVKVVKKIEGKSTLEEIRNLSRGDYFGEYALLKSDIRTASIIANADIVECLALDRESFKQLIGDLRELQDKEYSDLPASMRKSLKVQPIGDKKVSEEYAELRLRDLEVISTLGVGGFGRVELVQIAGRKGEKQKTYALKCLKKKHIVDTEQQEHVYSEKRIMMNCRHQFITSLYRTFKDSKYVYLLMECCLGGELWTILRDKGWFDDLTTRFYVACVISAVDYLHGQGIIYRDLKPENLLLDSQGYVKMVDFGFSKVLSEGGKTWTFCGTPEYVAPEIILNRGHDRSVDYWSLGVLMCELLIGTPPFTASDPMKIYNIILRGVDQIQFPRHVSKMAINIIKKFCKENPAERLGYQKNGILDIKNHRWFCGFDWDGLNTRKLQPPYVPKIKSITDASNFDNYPREKDIPPDEFSGWDATF